MIRRVVAITDPRWATEHLARTVRALPRGLCVVQLRDERGVRDEDARCLLEAARASDSIFVVNGNVALAKRIGADGTHLGGTEPNLRAARAILGKSAWISTAAHDDAAVERALRDGATAALVSPIFATPGKGQPRGVEAIRSAREIAGKGLLLYALGGVDPRRAASCAAAGADGVAAIRAIFEAPDPAAAVSTLAEPFR